MANYFVGDLHGCFDELQLLLEKVEFEPTRDKLYLVGDLVARGDKSLECLRFVKSLGQAAQTVLGNHDLHFIATTLGIKKVKPRDRVDAIFNAPDFEELVDWLCHQPLLVHNENPGVVMAHAGISPDWDLATAKACAKEVEEILQNGDFAALLAQMYDNSPNRWSPDLQGIERLRYSINVFTRMRFCYWDHRLDFACKAPPKAAPAELTPWFNLPNPLYQQIPIVFGHWASLVDEPTPQNIYALDTGCVWNNRMTMLRWEDKGVFTQSAIKNYNDF
ncbi:bis(5'-nucleosyl)-tetraphosphatase (symmetrical) [Rodentibacter trehalosifermentans]|uniref:Bis(5'-nucleosyl)-tetraphosphatase, symmetrical n=1 Tax=Rodentibacter trehalosifermentans TaxID=1908263 RepID=A0A1V3IUS0_9PAST|nr:bis(5'-nucleosyl)-tetraphosphatase (symmetrical) ApaH [Rodentibacter trehalosifermentans]OOF45859.1 bis(5'-nucleosyl)-tetraphosphatase (symmetrical) [Rodentibacter trehalosifermentans]OOF50223.1 bis(5'-nucleosyl)-tetraphosphatase (symmetrical) [Rodentibacter trehalosifermentans]